MKTINGIKKKMYLILYANIAASFFLQFLFSTTFYYYIPLPNQQLLFLIAGLPAVLISILCVLSRMYSRIKVIQMHFKPIRLRPLFAFIRLDILKICILFIAYIYWIVRLKEVSEFGILLIVCFACALEEEYFNHLIQILFNIGVWFIIILFIFSLLGILENNRANSFGIIYRTDYAAHLLFLMLLFCFYYDGEIKATGQLGLIALTIYNAIAIRGKVAFVCMAAVTFLTLWRYYRRHGVPYTGGDSSFIGFIFLVIYTPVKVVDKLLSRGMNLKNKKIIHRFHVVSFVFWTLVMLLGTACWYPYLDKLAKHIPFFGSVVARFHLTVINFSQYSIKLFGNWIPQQGAGGLDGYNFFYNYLDCSYAMLLLYYGLIAYVLIVGLMTLLSYRLYKAGRYYQLFLMAIVALDCFIEHHLSDMSYNVFALMAFCSFSKTTSHSSEEDLSKAFQFEKNMNGRQQRDMLSMGLGELDNLDGSRISQKPIMRIPPLWMILVLTGIISAVFLIIPVIHGVWSGFQTAGCVFCVLTVAFGMYARTGRRHIVSRGENIDDSVLFGYDEGTLIYSSYRSFGYFAIIVILVIICFLGAYSAYKISQGSDWTPMYNCTFVLPGSQNELSSDTDLVESCISSAEYYLEFHRDALCLIVPSTKEEGELLEKKLIEAGIDSSRLRVLESEQNLQGVMKSAGNFMSENSMPKRMALAVYNWQIPRVHLLAHDMDIVVNGYAVESTWWNYLPSYWKEQGLYLKESFLQLFKS